MSPVFLKFMLCIVFAVEGKDGVKFSFQPVHEFDTKEECLAVIPKAMAIVGTESNGMVCLPHRPDGKEA